MPPADSLPPAHDLVGPLTRTVEVLSLAAAAVLLTASGARLVTSANFMWWIPLVIVAAGLAADLLSGIVHWGADTWGRETLPVLGRRFLRPFRVHHINPGDFLRRDFIDCNGDVAMLVVPMLAGGFWIPLGTPGSDLAGVFLTSFAAWMLPTNQVHQWAHMPDPPRLVAWLQRRGSSSVGSAPGTPRVAVCRELLHRHRLVQPVADDIQVFPRLERAISQPHRHASACRRGAFHSELRAGVSDRRVRPLIETR